jgi:hypothetical protein
VARLKGIEVSSQPGAHHAEPIPGRIAKDSQPANRVKADEKKSSIRLAFQDLGRAWSVGNRELMEDYHQRQHSKLPLSNHSNR